jgi:hypothetical protein
MKVVAGQLAPIQLGTSQHGVAVRIKASLVACLTLVAGAPDAPAQSIPVFTLAPEWRVDAVEHDLSPIGWVAVSNSGTIAIAQPQDNHIRFFSARGAPVSTFGRKGQGPGEFGVMTLHGRVGDTLWVADFGTRRFTLIGPDGHLIRSHMFPTGIRFSDATPRPWPSFLSAPPWGLYGNGDVLLLPYPTGESTPAWMSRPEGTLMPFIRVSRDGLFDRVVAWTHDPDCGIGVGGRTWTKPLCFRPFWAVSRNGGVVVTASLERSDAGTDYVRAIAVRPSGDTLFSSILAVPRQRISRAVTDSVREQFAATVAKSAPDVSVDVEMPETYPPFDQGIVSRDERTIWLESGVATGDRRWHVVDLTGKALGDVRVPRRLRLQVVGLDRVWAIERDNDGLESVVVLRVQR